MGADVNVHSTMEAAIYSVCVGGGGGGGGGRSKLVRLGRRLCPHKSSKMQHSQLLQNGHFIAQVLPSGLHL